MWLKLMSPMITRLTRGRADYDESTNGKLWQRFLCLLMGHDKTCGTYDIDYLAKRSLLYCGRCEKLIDEWDYIDD